MITFNVKEFKKNIGLLSAALIVVLSTLFVSILISGNFLPFLEEKPLDNSGSINTRKLIISEVMTSNRGAYADENGELFDWIELYNGSDVAINLHNFGLSDVRSKVRWVFPEVSIEAKSYLVVYLTGENRNGLYANFALKSSGGETLVLTNSGGNVIDALDIYATNNNQSLARDNNGQWFTSNKITPGFANTEEGYQQFVESLVINQSDLLITEFLPKNEGNFIDDFDEFSGYIEITNFSDMPIDLTGYTLSNSLLSPFRFALPSITLQPSEALAVFTSSREFVGENIYAGFTLNNEQGIVILGNNQGKIIDQQEYTDVINGYARVLVVDQWITSASISPGYANNIEGIKSFGIAMQPNRPTLLINELMTRNYSYIPQNGGQFYDWIELYNNSSKTINLKDYSLTTSPNRIDMYQLPDIELKPNEYYIVTASGDERLSNTSYLHAPFKIGDIDEIYLFKDKQIIDSVFVADIPIDYSLGRAAEGGFVYISRPTPGSRNNSGFRTISVAPATILAAGVYNDIERLAVPFVTYGPTYYTLDGSVPTKSSRLYQEPIVLDKTTVIRLRTIEDNKVNSNTITVSYIINENHTMPVMSLALNPSDYQYLVRDVWKVGVEVNVHTELYEDGSSFSIDGGLRLFGGSARGFAKKSFALKFRGRYGESSLHYQVFDDRDFSVFDTLVLRSGSQDYPRALIRDVLATSLADELMEVDVQAYKPVVLYINGAYWGVYNIRQKVDAQFVSSHYNVDERSNIVRIDGDVSAGSSRDYYRMVNYAINNDLRLSSHYEYMKSILDMNSYVDFWIASTITTNNDIVNARFFSHPDINNGRWQMIFYDLDWAMYNYHRDYLVFATDPNNMTAMNISTALFRNLIVNKEFQTLFLERLSYHLKVTWNTERVLNRIDELYLEYYPEMERNQKRWNLTMENWEYRVNVQLKEYFLKRTDYLLAQTRAFFKLSDADFEKYFGGL